MSFGVCRVTCFLTLIASLNDLCSTLPKGWPVLPGPQGQHQRRHLYVYLPLITNCKGIHMGHYTPSLFSFPHPLFSFPHPQAWAQEFDESRQLSKQLQPQSSCTVKLWKRIAIGLLAVVKYIVEWWARGWYLSSTNDTSKEQQLIYLSNFSNHESAHLYIYVTMFDYLSV